MGGSKEAKRIGKQLVSKASAPKKVVGSKPTASAWSATWKQCNMLGLDLVVIGALCHASQSGRIAFGLIGVGNVGHIGLKNDGHHPIA